MSIIAGTIVICRKAGPWQEDCVCLCSHPTTCEPTCNLVAQLVRRTIAARTLRVSAVAPALEPALVLRPQRRLIDQYPPTLSVLLKEARAIVAVARVDGVVGRLSAAHYPRHVHVQRGGQLAVPVHVALIGAVQLVLHLRQHDRPTTIGEVRTSDRHYRLHPLLHRVQPRLVVRPVPHAILVRQPRRYAAIVPLGAHIRPDAQVGEQTSLRDGFEEQRQVASTRPVHRVLCRLVVVPEHIDLDHVQSIRCCLFHELRPHGWCGARVVDAAGQEGDRLSVETDRSTIVRHGVGLAGEGAEQREGGRGGIADGEQRGEDDKASDEAAGGHGIAQRTRGERDKGCRKLVLRSTGR